MKGKLIQGSWSQQTEKDISYQWVQKMPDIELIEKGISILKFQESFQKRNTEMEFRLIRRITETQFHNEKLKNYDPNLNKMNRYNNIIPYEHTIVNLEKDSEDEENLYINASFIGSIFEDDDKNKFIATQGPLPNTQIHFWKMIWQNDVECIVMVCNLKENDKVQCEQYWPIEVNQEVQQGIYKLKLVEEILIFQNLYKRTILLEKENSDIKKKFININLQNGETMEFLVKKIIIAGVGRTGTLISLVNLMIIVEYYVPIIQEIIKNQQSIENLNNCNISIFGTVRKIREQRWGMVHHSEQYAYLYKYMNLAIEKVLKIINADKYFNLQLNSTFENNIYEGNQSLDNEVKNNENQQELNQQEQNQQEQNQQEQNQQEQNQQEQNQQDQYQQEQNQ
ncbi:protein-tyrosine phosphatase protein, putative [Ichthyophthirius multifiliis]|uniref:Protein-tyrosine phosphatase protein, putative n=1 Tax=Ichthyophthirius multifiliis TaxID=5932 RepID=G0QIV6_ICHMU|nr:protein-tyrosine phosphatase protein, putative [Ichthyophthirius multifiliis]EGR34841.1 protein-tyrosine phosphatase protein, putative [Ichthyophthirius multifiliis]|eukprot:XP_004040145.1 protein-tyrosine phosphatase protein, putative [Ichthyophthirius multifiliis]